MPFFNSCQASPENSQKLCQAEQNNDRAKDLHQRAKLAEPKLVGLRILADGNHAERDEHAVNAADDRIEAGDIYVCKSVSSVGPPGGRPKNAEEQQNRYDRSPNVNGVQASLLLVGFVGAVRNDSDADDEWNDGSFPAEQFDWRLFIHAHDAAWRLSEAKDGAVGAVAPTARNRSG
jgi:hypothetical protein